MATMLHPPSTEVNFTEMPEVYVEGLSQSQPTLRSRRGGGRRTESPDRAWYGEGRKKGVVNNENLPPGQQPAPGPLFSPEPQPSLPPGLKGGGVAEGDTVGKGPSGGTGVAYFAQKVSRGVKSLVGMHKGDVLDAEVQGGPGMPRPSWQDDVAGGVPGANPGENGTSMQQQSQHVPADFSGSPQVPQGQGLYPETMLGMADLQGAQQSVQVGGQSSGYPATTVTGMSAFAPGPSAGRGEVTAHDTAAWGAQPYGGTDPAMLRGFELTGGGEGGLHLP